MNDDNLPYIVVESALINTWKNQKRINFKFNKFFYRSMFPICPVCVISCAISLSHLTQSSWQSKELKPRNHCLFLSDGDFYLSISRSILKQKDSSRWHFLKCR